MSSEMKMTEMEAAITRALEQRREVAVPAEFAARGKCRLKKRRAPRNNFLPVA